MNNPKHPTIARIWHGCTRREQSDEYEAFNMKAEVEADRWK